MKNQKTGPKKYAPLSSRCRKSFDARIRHRGEEYFYQGLVSDPVISGAQANLKVMGTAPYRVQLNWSFTKETNEIWLQCSCPHFKKGELCKHSWASILKLDKERVGEIIPGSFDLKFSSESNDEFIEGQAEKPWFAQLQKIQVGAGSFPAISEAKEVDHFKPRRLGYYSLDIEGTKNSSALSIKFYHREVNAENEGGAFKPTRLSRDEIGLYREPVDREIMSTILNSSLNMRENRFQVGGPLQGIQNFSLEQLPARLQNELLKNISDTGRFVQIPTHGQVNKTPPSLRFEDRKPWQFELVVKKLKTHYAIDGQLVRDGESVPVDAPQLCLKSGIVIFDDSLGELKTKSHFSWIASLRQKEIQAIPEGEGMRLVESLYSDPHCPKVHWPKELEIKQEKITPVPKVTFSYPLRTGHSRELLCDLKFLYDSFEVSGIDEGLTIFDSPGRRLIERDPSAENLFLQTLQTIPGIETNNLEFSRRIPFRVVQQNFTNVVATLFEKSWVVEAHGQKVKLSNDFNIKVSSGVDWFDLTAEAKFEGGGEVKLPDLLSAMTRGEMFVPLGNGTVGMLPTEWLKKYAPLSGLGEKTSEGLRFSQNQGVLLGAWLAETEINEDAIFAQLRENIKSFGTLEAISPRKSFKGKLRPYQKDGLSWLGFLRKIGFGGILADDMGLGKTVQLLAHLDGEYQDFKEGERLPSIIVLPKSLLFNWSEEAARFTPKLKVMMYAGADRRELFKNIGNHDIILVTYSTLRQDLEQFRTYNFHYIITDEAQAIKNSQSQSHMACRLIKARHRLAMTGTPVENSIEDLFSILDFVSPGLLGQNTRSKMSRAATHGKIDNSLLNELSQALKPFILRRTKDQVLKDLPEKTEMVLHCELSPEGKKYYEELRDYYRAHLKEEIDRQGLAKSKIVVLEALLRLRQAACHPGLIDKKYLKIGSAKTEMLMSQLHEIISEGHKTLVFSQFTKFLDIVETDLKRENVTYVRLDGKTSQADRRERVSRFQTDPDTKVFLISLKAGGVGLNLTAADYVFILDPWWNPAVESQAIDRSHRIGQKNKVIAYRLIAKDTVEEKIIELQKSKRELASAIVTADASLLRKITTNDIEILLS